MPKPGQKQVEKKQQTINVNKEKTEGGVYQPRFNDIFQNIADEFEEEQQEEELKDVRKSISLNMPSAFDAGEPQGQEEKRRNSVTDRKLKRDPADDFVVLEKKDFVTKPGEETEEDDEYDVTTRSKVGNLRIDAQEHKSDKQTEKYIKKLRKPGFFQRLGLGSKSIKFDKKYTYVKNDDSPIMKRIRDKLFDAFEAMDKEKEEENSGLSRDKQYSIKKKSLSQLRSLQKTVEGYITLKWKGLPGLVINPFKSIKYFRRWKEVSDLNKRLTQEIENREEELKRLDGNYTYIQEPDREMEMLMASSTKLNYLAAMGVGVAGVLVGNTVRSAGRMLLYPIWAINEGIRKIVKWTGHKPQRHLRLPGTQTYFTYARNYINYVSGRSKAYEIKDKRDSHWYDIFFEEYKTDEDINERARLDMDMIDYDYGEKDNPNAWDEYKQYARPATEEESKAVDDYVRGIVTYVEDEKAEKKYDKEYRKAMGIDESAGEEIKEEKKKDKKEDKKKDKNEDKKAETEKVEEISKAGKEKEEKEKQEEDNKKKEAEKKEPEKKNTDPIEKMLSDGLSEFSKANEAVLNDLYEKYSVMDSNLQSLETSSYSKADKAAMKKGFIEDMREYARGKGIFQYVDEGVKAEQLRAEDYTDEKRAGYEEYLKSRGLSIGRNAAANTYFRSRFTEFNVLAQDYVWKPGTDQKIKEAYNWLGEYYSVRNVQTEKIRAEKSKIKLEMPDHHIDLEDIELINKEYEKQHKASLNCFACAGAEMYRQFCRKEKILAMPVDQDSIRSYKPEFKKYSEVGDKIKEIDPMADESYFNDSLTEVNEYLSGKKVGNIYELGDFFIGKQKNAMLNKAIIQYPPLEGKLSKAEKEKRKHTYNNMKAFFLNKVYEGLTGGHVVTVVMQSPMKHYRTIVGIDGDKVKFVDSLGGMHGVVHNQSIDKEFLPDSDEGQGLELVWMSKLEKKEDLLKKYSHLGYSEEKGYYNNDPSMDDYTQVAQTGGVNVSKGDEDTDYSIPGVSESIYIPRFGA